VSFSKPPGSDAICAICLWRDDISQLRFPGTAGGTNRLSLIESQRNFRSFGAAEERSRPHVRKSGPEDKREPWWRPFNPKTDNPERQVMGVEYGGTYPANSTTLYYWRDTYWRRKAM